MAGPSGTGGYDASTASAYAAAGAQALGAGAGSDLLAQSTMYDPNAPAKPVKDKMPTGKRDTVLRKGGGKVWEDTTLIDWDPSELHRRLEIESIGGSARPAVSSLYGMGASADHENGTASLSATCQTTSTSGRSIRRLGTLRVTPRAKSCGTG